MSTFKRADVALLADTACVIDEMKSRFTEPTQYRRLQQAVALIHEVADEADRAGDFGVYAHDDADDATATVSLYQPQPELSL